MKTIRLTLWMLYFPASAALLWQASESLLLSHRLVSLALALFCVELARMAAVDLCNVLAVSEKGQAKEGQADREKDLNRFRTVVVSTIVLELIGFYTALFYVACGAAVVIFSQLWFNWFVGIQLWPGLTPEITVFKIQQRIPVLAVNALALLMLSLWFVPAYRLWIAVGLLVLIVLFLVVKYCVPGSQPQHPSCQNAEQSAP